MQQKFKITKEREVVLKKFGIRSPNDPDICLRCNAFDYRGKSWEEAVEHCGTCRVNVLAAGAPINIEQSSLIELESTSIQTSPSCSPQKFDVTKIKEVADKEVQVDHRCNKQCYLDMKKMKDKIDNLEDKVKWYEEHCY